MDIFAQALRTLWANKLRSFLTMFGIAYGVFSLLMLIGVGEGFRSGQRKNMVDYCATPGNSANLAKRPGFSSVPSHCFLPSLGGNQRDFLGFNAKKVSHTQATKVTV